MFKFNPTSGFLILVLLFVVNPWIYKILAFNVSITLLIIILSQLFLHQLMSKSFSWPHIITGTIITILLFCLIGIDLKVFSPLPQELFLINQNRSYYSKWQGIIFQNKLALTIDKIGSNFYVGIDPNQYFFAAHPLEKQLPSEFEKILWVFYPLFLAGLFYSLSYYPRKLLTFATPLLLLNSIVDPGTPLSLLLIFPLIYSQIAVGILFTLNKIKPE